jgi:hypothetical protein
MGAARSSGDPAVPDTSRLREQPLPKLYVANATQQVNQFTYWLPETPRWIMQEIAIGGQILVNNRDLPSETITYILDQHRKYGICTPAEAARNPRFSGIVYSIDRPVSYSLLLDLVNKRNLVLVEQGQVARQEAAIATDAAIQDVMQTHQMPGRLQNLDMSVEEVSRDPRDDSPEISEGVRVSHRPADQESTPRSRGRARAGARRAAIPTVQ